MTYKIKNWSRFQHFKDRRPPWVKLYRDLLDDLDWFELDPLASKTLINLWLIASEYDGCLPSLEILAFRLRLKKQELTNILSSLSHWLEQVDINSISEGYQHDRPETETETETETYKPISVETKFPPCPYSNLLDLWKKHLPHLTQPRTWEGTRQTNMKQRWIQASKKSQYSPDGYGNLNDGIAWWDSFFDYMANDTKLGQGFESNGRTWKPDLEWVMNASNFQKIIDGKYNK